MKMKLSFLLLLICNYAYLGAQKISLGARNTWHHFLGPVQIDSVLWLPNRPITDTADAQKNKKLKYPGVLFYGTNGSNPALLYYYDGKNFITVATEKEEEKKDSSIYSYNGQIKENRIVTLNENKLSFKNSSNNTLVLKAQNIGIGTDDPQQNLHLNGTLRIEKNAKNNHVLTAINNQGDAQWRQPQNIYTTDGSIKTTSGGTTITIPDNTKIKFTGPIAYKVDVGTPYLYPKAGRKGTNLQYEINNSILPRFGFTNIVSINRYGNLSVLHRTGSLNNNDIRSVIPLLIDGTGPSIDIYANSNTTEIIAHDIYNLNNRGLKRLTNSGTSPHRLSSFTLQALIGGNVLIEGGSLTVTSDRRIKKVKGKALPSESVRRLKNLNVYHYQFKDTLAKGNKMMTGVMAQELVKVMPEAVLQLPGSSIPDIYKHADSVKNAGNNTRIYLPIRLNTDSLKVGTELKFYLTDNKTERRKILKITENYIEVPYLCAENERVFVYGSFINDLLNVDYNQVFMENVNVTKYLLKQQEILEQQLKEQINSNQTQQKELKTQQKQINTLEQKLKEQNNLLQKLLKKLK